MRGVNKVIIIGNATRDAELHQTKTGKQVANLRLATNRRVKGPDGQVTEDTQYHTVLCFGRLAEITAQYVTRGKPIYVEGRLETRKFTDKQGRERETYHIIANDVQFLGGGRTDKVEEPDTPAVEDGEAEDVDS